MDQITMLLQQLVNFLLAFLTLIVNFFIAVLQLILSFAQSLAGGVH